ncbi:MAG: IspD/TarI family cytidylyltransferase [Acidimicrobiaceae bacterium]|nr:IspD/TarI family cytidylyltransferase [Acidimicrobiaceae bacterium]MCY3608191.1 IspD/TarI family cytidylyltransferase [Acidimicrobiaceae bacterium]
MLAAGAGTRFGAAAGGASKVMVPVAGRSMVAWSVEATRAACDAVTLVVPVQTVEVLADGAYGVDVVVAGGATRSGSVRAGLETVPDDVDVVVCHDAARPGASAGLFAGVIAAVRDGADAAAPALPVSDTLKRVPEWDDSGGVVAETVDRSGLFAVQTPQAFRREALVAAHAGEPEATDDAALVEAAGGTVVAIPGEAAAHKVTTTADLVIVESLLRGRARDGGL